MAGPARGKGEIEDCAAGATADSLQRARRDVSVGAFALRCRPSSSIVGDVLFVCCGLPTRSAMVGWWDEW